MPAPAWAVSDDDAFVLNGTGQKFYALPSDRKGGASLSQEKPNEIKELKRGFIALDRNRDGGPRRVTSVRNQVNTVRGTQEDRDILSLFENELDKRPAASGQTAINHKWPVAASASQHMSSGYGMRKDPFHGQMRFHGGLDIAAAAGTPILASADGRVKETGYRAGFGNYVTLLHSDGSESMYSHLQKAEARLGTMVRQGQEIGKLGVWEVDLATGRIDCSDQALAIFGHDRSGPKPDRNLFRSLVHPEDLPGHAAGIERAVRTGQTYINSLRIIRPDGSTRNIQMRGEVVRDDSERVTGLSGTVIDVTDLVIAEEARQRSRRQFEVLFESAVSALLMIDGEGCIRLANRQTEEMIGRARAA